VTLAPAENRAMQHPSIVLASVQRQRSRLGFRLGTGAIVVLLLTAFLSIAEGHSWTDSTGKHHSSGKMVDFQGGVLYLKKDNGKIVAVPLRKLSGADRRFVESNTPPVKWIAGKVIGITDGDTLTVLSGTTSTKIRLSSVDAPERHQAYGSQSREALARKVFQKNVVIEWRSLDRYGRTLGQIFVDGRWINKDMVQDGWAWHYRRYSKSEVLEEAEREAREAKRGLWADSDPVPPWDFRHAPNKKPPVAAHQPNESTPSDTPSTIQPAPLGPTPDRSRATLPAEEVPSEGVAPVVVESEPNSPDTSLAGEIVYVTKSGSHYHVAGCPLLNGDGIPMALSEAIKHHTRCSKCHPPRFTPDPIDDSPFRDPDAETVPPVHQPTVTTPKPSSSGPIWVRGYYRRDGTYVRPHTRRRSRRS
jgi:endonuclease YncB( thermonuclease family)